jgi:hypothetical protein
MIVGCLSQSIKNRGCVRVPSSPIDVLARHLEHVTVADLLTDLLDPPALAEVLDTVPDPRSRRGRRYRLGPLLAGAQVPGTSAGAVVGQEFFGVDDCGRSGARCCGPGRGRGRSPSDSVPGLAGRGRRHAVAGYARAGARCVPEVRLRVRPRVAAGQEPLPARWDPCRRRRAGPGHLQEDHALAAIRIDAPERKARSTWTRAR